MVLGVGFFSFFVATITASLAAETASGNQKPAKSATLNARLAELDEALATKRITRAEHNRLRAKVLEQFR